MYRGKRIDNGEWAYGSHVWIDSTDYIYTIEAILTEPETDFYENQLVPHLVHPESVGMWTGLKDKKGVDVYEGDIFKSLLQIGVIKQKEGCWIVDWVKRPNALIEKLYPHVEEGEVISNTTDDKDLLKGN